MGRKTFSILYMIRRHKLLKNQEAPIYLRITVEGERSEISIKEVLILFNGMKQEDVQRTPILIIRSLTIISNR